MVFSSYLFIIFFVVVLVVTRLLESRRVAQNICLLAASLFFYGYWDWRFLGLLVATIVVDWGVGLGLDVAKSQRARKAILSVSIAANLGIIGFFKYFDFFQKSLERLLHAVGMPFDPHLLNVVLPMGISFYVFQSMSYTIDVYRREIKPCRSLLTFAFFVTYFPQLVAGPIERAGHLIPQLERPKLVRRDGVLSGILLIILGLMKKAVVADLVGFKFVDMAFNHPKSGAELMLGIVGFTIQIYGDFSGYTDIARGSSRCLGIELVDNFRAPYFSTNITEFWRRWHISLSTWFRDYLYISLGGNRRGPARTYFNLMLTMFLCGLWHGAKYTFVVWGIYHGALLLIHRILQGGKGVGQHATRTVMGPIRTLVSTLGTLCLVAYGWMIFRLSALSDLPKFTKLLLTPRGWFGHDPQLLSRALSLFIFFGGMTFVAHVVQSQAYFHKREIEDIPGISAAALGLAIGVMALAIVALGTIGEGLPFIYFQF